MQLMYIDIQDIPVRSGSAALPGTLHHTMLRAAESCRCRQLPYTLNQMLYSTACEAAEDV